jgi:hypothetical protein
LLFNREGDCLAAKLWPGNVHSAEDWEAVAGNRAATEAGKQVVFGAGHRGVVDAASGTPKSQASDLVQGFSLSGRKLETARRVVAKVEFHFGELFPRVEFIVTKLETDNRAVVRFYNKRGTAEQWIKEVNRR